MSRRLVLCVWIALTFACESERRAPATRLDSGLHQDASPVDSTVSRDAGAPDAFAPDAPSADSGPAPDATSFTDALLYPDAVVLMDAKGSADAVGAPDVAADAGPADADPADAGPADADPADADPADADPADADPADADPADADPADADPADIDSSPDVFASADAIVVDDAAAPDGASQLPDVSAVVDAGFDAGALLTLGSECTDGTECASGLCPPEDGVCCNEDCAGVCVACTSSQTGGLDGTCAPVLVGTDPAGECPDDGASSCGRSAQGCDGNVVAPACLLYDATTICLGSVCSAGQGTTASLCDGSGTCVAGDPFVCGNYACDVSGAGCRTDCSDNAHCTGINRCEQGVCDCTPATCLDLGADCGMISDTCGTDLECGICAMPQTCGGAGMTNVCGCTPITCTDVNADCGTIDDGCGGTLPCGTCTLPDRCGGGGDHNVCGGAVRSATITEVRPLIGVVQIPGAGLLRTGTRIIPSGTGLAASGFTVPLQGTGVGVTGSAAPSLVDLAPVFDVSLSTYTASIAVNENFAVGVTPACAALAPYDGVPCGTPSFEIPAADIVQGALQVVLTNTGTPTDVVSSSSIAATVMTIREISNIAADRALDDAPRTPILHDGRMFFSAEGAMGNRRLYAYDGSAIDWVSSSVFTWIRAVYDGDLYFMAFAAGRRERLYVYDGTDVTLLSAVNGGLRDRPENLTVFDGKLYFTAESGASSAGVRVLYEYDGSSIRPITTVVDWSIGVPPMIVFQGKLHFITILEADGRQGRMWSYDGTQIQQVSTIYPFNPTAIYNGRLMFSAHLPGHCNKLVEYDGVTITHVSDVNPGACDIPEYMTEFRGELYFRARNNGGRVDSKLFAYDGQRVRRISDINPGSDDDVRYLTVYNDKLFFVADNAFGVTKLFYYDGGRIVQVTNTSGEASVRDDVTSLYVFEDALYFAADNELAANKLYRLCDLSAGCAP